MFANIILTNEELNVPVPKKASPRTKTKTKKSSSPRTKSHHKSRTISEISDDDTTIAEDVPEELSVINYSEDFSIVPTESSTPRTVQPVNIRVEKQTA